MAEKVIEFPSPEIVAIRQDGKVERDYDFRLTQHTDCRSEGSGNTIYSHKIVLRSHRFLNRTVILDNGTTKQFDESDDSQGHSYSLEIDTEYPFGQAIELFREIGLPCNSQILMLSYDGTLIETKGDSFYDRLEKIADGEDGMHYAARSVVPNESGDRRRYFNTPFVLSDLDEPFVRDVDSCNGTIFIRIHGTGELSNTAFLYTQEEREYFGEPRQHRTIGYIDSDLVVPRLDQVLDASPLEISPEERSMLESMINHTLNL